MNVVKVGNTVIGDGIPKICVPIVEKTSEEILNAAKSIVEVPADLVEWRVDWFDRVSDIESVKTVLAELKRMLGDIPLIFTFRTKAEGGEQEIDKKEYARLNRAAIETGYIDLVDVEVYSMSDVICDLVKMAHGAGVKVIGSNHDFAKTPDKDEIIRRLCHMQDVGVDIPKIAVMPQDQSDVVTLLQATEEMACTHAERPIITMSMAGMGVVSRISGEIFGSAVTFGTVEKASAPGQIPVNDLKNMLEILHHSYQK